MLVHQGRDKMIADQRHIEKNCDLMKQTRVTTVSREKNQDSFYIISRTNNPKELCFEKQVQFCQILSVSF